MFVLFGFFFGFVFVCCVWWVVIFLLFGFFVVIEFVQGIVFDECVFIVFDVFVNMIGGYFGLLFVMILCVMIYVCDCIKIECELWECCVVVVQLQQENVCCVVVVVVLFVFVWYVEFDLVICVFDVDFWDIGDVLMVWLLFQMELWLWWVVLIFQGGFDD